MKKIILTSIIALLLGTTGCSTQQVKPVSYNQKALNLKVGMTKDEIINLLGTPKKVSAIKTPEGLEEIYSYWGISRLVYSYAPIDNEALSQDRLAVTFLDGKVTQWGDKFDPTVIANQTLKTIQQTSQQYQQMYEQQIQNTKEKK
jgi:outer membrane protein assembly factor BamE (lipoprotein component of BamABCDE complex)